jgi:ABC-2 type transport system ATP-binding protein/lipopolysaccharide transport system ATP-binding protein
MVNVHLKDVSLEYPVYTNQPKLFAKKLATLAGAGKFVKHNKLAYVRSVDNLTMNLSSGDRVGLIGNNGAGKTTVLKLIAGIYKPTSGSVSVTGSICSVLGSGFGLDEDATGYENIILGGIANGHSAKEMQGKVKDIEEFTRLGKFLDMPLKTYSAGMRARLAFAITTSFTSDILIMDEGIGVGDKEFYDKAQKRLDSFLDKANILIMASHSEALLKQFCNYGLVMKSGQKQYFGPIDEAFDYYNLD